MDRRAQQRRLHDGLALERTREVVPLERREPRPQADVARGGVLVLQAGDPLERPRHGEALAPEEELTGEHRLPQLRLRQDALGGHLASVGAATR
jgi:hypothetical protein